MQRHHTSPKTLHVADDDSDQRTYLASWEVPAERQIAAWKNAPREMNWRLPCGDKHSAKARMNPRSKRASSKALFDATACVGNGTGSYERE